MPWTVACPHCARPLSVPGELAGRAFACPLCQGSLVAPPAAAPHPAAPNTFDFGEPSAGPPRAVTPAQLAEHVAQLVHPWRAVYFGLRLARAAAWVALAVQVALVPVILFWPAGRDDSAPALAATLAAFAVAQLALVLLHVAGQFRCTALPPGECRRAAARSTWAGAGALVTAAVGSFAPWDVGGYVVFAAPVLLVFSAFHWQVFLRALATRLGAHHLESRVEAFTWWMWIAAACLVFRSSLPGPGVSCAALATTAVLALCVAMYAALVSAVSVAVATRAAAHGGAGETVPLAAPADPPAEPLDFAVAGEQPAERRTEAYVVREEPERIAHLRPEWQRARAGLDLTKWAAALLIPLTAVQARLSMAAGTEDPRFVTALPIVLALTGAAQVLVLLAHLRGQARCAALPAVAGCRAARVSGRFTAGAVAASLTGSVLALVLPLNSDAAVVAAGVLALVVAGCALGAVLYGLSFLRQLGDHLAARELSARVRGFVPWFWVAFWVEFVLALVDLAVTERPGGRSCFSAIAGVVTLLAVVNYVGLLQTARQAIARRGPTV